MKRLLIVLALLVAPAAMHAQTYSLPNNNAGCPSTCRQIPWVTGSDIWNSGTLPTYTGVTCNGLHNNGSTDDGALIQSCINALSSNQCAVIPAGTNYYINSTVRLKSNTCLRGAQPEGQPPYLPTSQSGETRLILGTSGWLTTQNFSSSSGDLDPATSYNTLSPGYTITNAPQKGDTTFTKGTGTLSTGDWISVFADDDSSLVNVTGTDGHCDWCGENTGHNVQIQIVQVTNVSGSTITISKPFYYTLSTHPQYRKYTFPTQKAGFENLRIDGSAHDIGATQIILLQGCLECWVKSVETYDTGSSSGSAHVEMDYTYGDEVRDSAFHDQRSGASGSGYGVYFQFANSDAKVENNVFFHNRHWVVYQGGGSGTAILYNYADDGYTDDLTYFASGRTSHGAHPYFNLFEGNITSHIAADDFWGTTSHIVFFRNWIRGGEPNHNYGSGTIGSFPPNNGFAAVDLYTGQEYYAYVDNVLGNPGLGAGISGTWSAATLSGFNEYAAPSTPLVYSYGGALGGSASSSATIIRQGNYDYKTLGVAYNDGGAGYSYAPSMYYASEPSFISSAGCSYPAQGSDLTTKGSLDQPAYVRAMGLTCSGSTAGGSAFQGVKITGAIL